MALHVSSTIDPTVLSPKKNVLAMILKLLPVARNRRVTRSRCSAHMGSVREFFDKLNLRFIFFFLKKKIYLTNFAQFVANWA